MFHVLEQVRPGGFSGPTAVQGPSPPSMGATWSTPELVKPFRPFSLWSHEQSERLLTQYQTSNLFFGIDARELAFLTGESTSVSNEVVAALSKDGSTRINALSFILGVIAVADSGAAAPSLVEPKLRLMFRAFDFNDARAISLDEMTLFCHREIFMADRFSSFMTGTRKAPNLA